MEENEKTTVTQQTLQGNFDSLCEQLRIQMPEPFVRLGDVPLNFHGEYACAVLPMTTQQMMDDFLTLLETKLDVNILYAFRKDKGRYYESMGYSAPKAGRLYLVILTSHQHGVVDRMKVLLYESYEPMLDRIKEALADLPRKGAERILEEENVTTVYSHFFK